MKNFSSHATSIALTAWVGSLWAIGYLAVPILFHAQPDRQLAGLLAGQMFAAQGYLGMTCAAYLLLHRWLIVGKAMLPERATLLIFAMLAITLFIQFGIQPWMAQMKAQALPQEVMQSAYAASFRLWHGVSNMLYLIESLLGSALLVVSLATQK